MNVKLHFEEISNYVEKHYKVRPQLRKVDGKTLEVSYNPGLFIPTITIVVKIEAMRRDVVCLSYECSKAMNLIVSGAIAHMEGKLPKGIEINTEDRRINVYPEHLAEVKKVLEYIQLEGIHINDDGIEIVSILT